MEYLQDGNSLSLRELIRDPHNLDASLPCMPFSIVRGENRIMLPSENETLVTGDEVLFCGTEHGERMLAASMNNTYTSGFISTRNQVIQGIGVIHAGC